MSLKIEITESKKAFSSAAQPLDKEWIGTSFHGSERAVGELRFPAVSNGRYETKHPIFDANGATVGLLGDGVRSLGYTYACIYAGGCFWVVSIGFGAVLNGAKVSGVSLVDRKGAFFLTRAARFGVVKSFSFGERWAMSIKALKLLDDGACLLYLTNNGFCLFDTRQRDIIAQAEFSEIVSQWSGFALSPRVKLLALACSVRGAKDPLDGEYRYQNGVRIYNLETGCLVGERMLPGNSNTKWTVEFSGDGRELEVTSKSNSHVLRLTVKQEKH